MRVCYVTHRTTRSYRMTVQRFRATMDAPRRVRLIVKWIATFRNGPFNESFRNVAQFIYLRRYTHAETLLFCKWNRLENLSEWFFNRVCSATDCTVARSRLKSPERTIMKLDDKIRHLSSETNNCRWSIVFRLLRYRTSSETDGGKKIFNVKK